MRGQEVLKVDEYLRIRLAHRDGLGIRALSRKFGRSRQAIRKALLHSEPPGVVASGRRACPKLTAAFRGLIDQILAEDADQPPKQRHWSTQIHERLVSEHGYSGGYDQVRRYVRSKRLGGEETFVPLRHPAGSRVECDFGHIHVDFPSGRRLTPVLLVTWSHSHHCFAIALRSEKTEAILHGMTEAFSFFSSVPLEVWWDNPKTVAQSILTGRERTVHPRYQALASHYRFDPRFCMPARGNEKPHVENRVKRLQRRWATPVPSFADLAALNGYLRGRCEEELSRTVQRKETSIGERFSEDRAGAAELPARPFDACVSRPGKVDKYQSVRHETNWYSVPREVAFRTVTVKAYVDRIEVIHQGKLVARHERCYGRHEQILDPLHYLPTLGRKPATLDHADVYRAWKLPGAFARLRDSLRARHGDRRGDREYIRVLQLLGRHSIDRVAQAIDRCQCHGIADAGLIEQEADRQSARQAAQETRAVSMASYPESVRDSRVARTGLAHFDRLLSKEGESDDDRSESRLAEGEPEDASAADHVGRMGTAGP